MGIELTLNALNASLSNSIELNIVFEIDGVDSIFGAVPIKKFVRIGDPDLEIGDPELNPNAFYIGGFNLVPGQKDYISLDKTTTTITQQLQIDRGKSSGVPSFQVSLVDFNNFVTELITPDETQSPVFDILGRKCKISLGFANTAFPDDFVPIFRGYITDIESASGNVLFSINSPDNKKRKTLFKDATTELTAILSNVATTATVEKTTDFLVGITPPGGGSPVSEFKQYILVDDEIIRYTGKTATTFTGLTRAQFGTAAAEHAIGANVTPIYRMEGNVIDLALRIMMSGIQGNYLEDIVINNFNILPSGGSQANTLVFTDTNLVLLYGVVVGDYVTTSGALNGANNVSEKEIVGIQYTDDGHTLLTIAGVTFVNEEETNAVVGFRSQYDVFPEGMRLGADEVDIEQHLFIKNTFLPSVQYDFKIAEQIDDGKEWLEEKLYSPVAAFSIPRSAKASVGIHTGPIPGQNIKTLNVDNVKNAKDLKIRRSTERYFYNEIVYRYDKKPAEDKYLGGVVTVAQDSKNRIVGREKALTIDADGLTSALSAENVATLSSNRRISRYKFGAEFLTIKPFFGVGFPVEIGDIVVLDGSELQLSDIKNGSRDFQPRLMEVEQKSLNIKTGDITLELVDTNFSGQSRFGLISPSSRIATGLSQTQFIINPSYGNRVGVNEFLKYSRFSQLVVRVRSLNYTSRNAVVEVDNFSGNLVTVKTALGFTPQANDIMELADYSDLPLESTLVFASISDVGGGDFPDSTTSYVIL